MSNITEFFNSRASRGPKPSEKTPAKAKKKAADKADTLPSHPSSSPPIQIDESAMRTIEPVRITEPDRTTRTRQRKKATAIVKTDNGSPSSSPIPSQEGADLAAHTSQPAIETQDRHKSSRHKATSTLQRCARGDDPGQSNGESQSTRAGIVTNSEIDGHSSHKAHTLHAVESDQGGQSSPEIQISHAPLIAKIQYLWRMRQRWHRAEKSLILQGKALCRAIVGGDKTEGSALFEKARKGDSVDGIDDATALALAPFLLSIDQFEKPRLKYEKELAKLARKLPAHDFVLGVFGVGDGGFASIVGEAGDIGSYKSVSALWKRMGLAVMSGGNTVQLMLKAPGKLRLAKDNARFVR
jgi:hypothetical protein